MTEREILLTSILKCQRADLYAGKLALTKEQEERLAYYLSLRAKGKPLQYILGETDFFGLRFKVDTRALIPRPETEILVDAVIKQFTSHKSQVTSQVKILDVGTGSGCIAVSLAKSLPDARVTALDISCQALELARENALINGVSERINFIQSDLFPPGEGGFDIIVSNPPYVFSQEIDKLSPEVRSEPRLALDGGNEGLDFYRRIIPLAGGFLKNGGFLALEIGFQQRQGIEEIVNQQGWLRVKEVIKDYSGIERVMVLSNG
ncbi:MAG TPA: peptide chain release factor N(5)-glutamine methyltransferase [Candidatus Omnitrophota bacterium]|nr:peptide chain release factor N(5)-glutamine methyltransferase [Candidatus Omnitrophota bacterium]